MVYVGIAYATAFISTSFPAYDSSFSFLPDSLLSSLSCKALKVFCFDLHTNDGKPKSVSCCRITSAPKPFFVFLYVMLGISAKEKSGFVLVELLA